ncbi:MAG: hypothetical protein WBF81_09390 [Thermoplasmata archaeon]
MKSEQGEERRNPAKRPGRWIGGIAAAAALVVVLFLVPTTLGAVSPAASTIFTAPYKGLPEDATFIDTEGCGATIALSVGPSFVAKTGVGTYSGTTSSKACPDQFGEDSSDIIAEVGYNGSLWKQTASGKATATALFNLSWKASVKASTASPKQSADASVSILIELAVVSASTQEVVASGLTLALTMEVTNGTMTSHKVDYTLKCATDAGKLVSGKQYYLTAEIEIVQESDVTSTGSSSASTSLNMGTGGNEAQMVSITVS